MQPWEQFAQTPRAAPLPQPWEHFAAQATPSPAQPGFIDRVGADLTNRANEGADAIVAYRNGDQGLGQTVLQLAGKMGAGAANDIVGEGISALTPDVVKQGLASGAQGTANAIDSTGMGQKVGDALMGARDAYDRWTQNNPNAARSVESAANIVSALPLAKAVESTGQSVADVGRGSNKAAEYAVNNDIGKSLPSILGDTRSGSIKPTPITRDMVRNAGSNAYKYTENVGVEGAPQLTNDLLSIVENGMQKPFFGGSVLTSEQKSINDALSEFLPAKGKSANLSDIQALDSTLGEKAAQAYLSGEYNKARIIGDVQDGIRARIQPGNIKPGDINGTSEGIRALTNDAIPLWSTQAKMADIEKIIERGNMMDNPSTAIKTGLRNYALNEGKMAQLPEGVQKLVRKGAETGKVDDLLGVFGSRLNQIAANAVGGLPGAVISNASSMAARGLRTGLKSGQANAILNAMVENVRPIIEKYSAGIPEVAAPPTPPPEPIRLLPAPQKELLVDNSGNIRPQTPYEQYTANTTRQNYQNLGLTPDVLTVQARQNAQRLLQKYGQSEVGRFLANNPNIRLDRVLDIPQTEYSRAQVDAMMRNSDWDKLTKLQQDKINLDIERAWREHQTPVAEMVMDAQQKASAMANTPKADVKISVVNQLEKSRVKGKELTGIGEAFRRAINSSGN